MSPDGKHLMMGMQATLADNKIVEDVHAPLRLASKGNNNDKLAAVTIQDVINHSRVMEQRTINHNVAVSKETFIRDFKGTAIKSQTAGHNCSNHKLPKEFSRMTHPGAKPWKTLNDDSIHKAVAAWNWIHEFFAKHRAAGAVGIGGSRLSQLMKCLTIVRQISSQTVRASMGSSLFAAIGLKLHMFEVEGVQHFTFTPDYREFEIVYVTNAMDWETIPFTATRLQGHGIVMAQSAAPMPLIRYSLLQTEHPLTEDDIINCLESLKIRLTPPNNKISDMLLALAKHFCGADNGDAQVEADMYAKALTATTANTDEQLLEDPLLEAVYDDMDEEDKGEFPEIGVAKRKNIEPDLEPGLGLVRDHLDPGPKTEPKPKLVHKQQLHQLHPQWLSHQLHQQLLQLHQQLLQPWWLLHQLLHQLDQQLLQPRMQQHIQELWETMESPWVGKTFCVTIVASWRGRRNIPTLLDYVIQLHG